LAHRVLERIPYFFGNGGIGGRVFSLVFKSCRITSMALLSCSSVPANLVGDACYAVGRFLDKRGETDAAVKYLIRGAAGGGSRTSVSKTLASYDLRQRGLKPGEDGDKDKAK